MSRERKVAAICKVTRETTNQLNVATFIDDVARLHAKCNRTLGDAMELLQHAPAFCLSSRSWFRPTEERRETSLSPPLSLRPAPSTPTLVRATPSLRVWTLLSSHPSQWQKGSVGRLTTSSWSPAAGTRATSSTALQRAQFARCFPISIPSTGSVEGY